VVYWSEFLATDPEVRVRSPSLRDFLKSRGSTQSREYNFGAAWKEKAAGLQSRKSRLRPWGSDTLTTWHVLFAKGGTNVANKRRSLSRLVRSRTQTTDFVFRLFVA
jgi:hypothetical protein